MKKMLGNNKVRLYEIKTDQLPEDLLLKYDLLCKPTDIAFIIQVKLNQNLWSTKRLFLRREFKFGFDYLLNGKRESDLNFKDRTIKEYYNYLKNCYV